MSGARGEWPVIVRLGLVQASIGAIVVLMTSTVNRVMIVELGLAAAVPGALVALHFAVQLLLRPHFGHASDGRRRTPLILGGMALLAASGVAAAGATALLATDRVLGAALATVAFVAIGAGVSAAGTPLLALLAERAGPARRARAAATVWLMMIAGFIVTTVGVSRLLEPFSLAALVRAVAIVAGVAVTVAAAALWRLEPGAAAAPAPAAAARPTLRAAVASVWTDPPARTFAIFVFASMLAYSAQDLILEPFAGAVFGFTPAESTRVSGMHQGGMLAGMLLAAALAQRVGTLRHWATAGCAASAVAFVVLAFAPVLGGAALLRASIVALGLANGAFAIGAIGSMMALSVAADGRAGVRMGVFGAAQAIAYALGGFAGAAGSDLGRLLLGSPAAGYAAVFLVEAALFAVAATLAARGAARQDAGAAAQQPAAGDTLLAQLG